VQLTYNIATGIAVIQILATAVLLLLRQTTGKPRRSAAFNRNTSVKVSSHAAFIYINITAFCLGLIISFVCIFMILLIITQKTAALTTERHQIFRVHHSDASVHHFSVDMTNEEFTTSTFYEHVYSPKIGRNFITVSTHLYWLLHGSYIDVENHIVRQRLLLLERHQ